jgi:hypothetical protein
MRRKASLLVFITFIVIVDIAVARGTEQKTNVPLEGGSALEFSMTGPFELSYTISAKGGTLDVYYLSDDIFVKWKKIGG